MAGVQLRKHIKCCTLLVIITIVNTMSEAEWPQGILMLLPHHHYHCHHLQILLHLHTGVQGRRAVTVLAILLPVVKGKRGANQRSWRLSLRFPWNQPILDEESWFIMSNWMWYEVPSGITISQSHPRYPWNQPILDEESWLKMSNWMWCEVPSGITISQSHPRDKTLFSGYTRFRRKRDERNMKYLIFLMINDCIV